MNAKKPRKSLEDALAGEFVYGSQERVQIPSPSTPPLTAEPQPKEPSLMSELQAPAKELTVRLTVDMPESMHKKLSILAAKTGRKKADIVRFLLSGALKDIEE